MTKKGEKGDFGELLIVIKDPNPYDIYHYIFDGVVIIIYSNNPLSRMDYIGDRHSKVHYVDDAVKLTFNAISDHDKIEILYLNEDNSKLAAHML